MGTTLQNGVYLPNEGERNCYAGLKTNWEILDQKVADITALQQAVAGALHREIVESLPTTDINPNTIYMILSGTSATENVYNEFMYVNNAWELIGTSATDLTNYYTKGEVDGLLLLKANASDLTSHTGDTTIHVTASDKEKWNTVALIKQLRLVNTQVGSATTIAFANIDDTNGIKVGDKCMDLDAKMFEITAVDTTNQTVTVGSALIGLALDANVVHTSGDESITGTKRFGVVQNFTGYTAIRIYSPNDEVGVLPSTSQVREIRFTDKNNVPISYFAFQHRASSDEPFRTCWRQQKLDGTSSYYSVNFNNLGEFYPENNNPIKLGTSTNPWAGVYATNYYYGSNNVEFSTKFVTTDTNQTISESKTFANTIKIKKEIELSGSRLAYILPEFSAGYAGLSLCTYASNGAVKIGSWKVDDNDNTKHVLDSSLGYLNVTAGSSNSINIVYLTPRNASKAKLGDSVYKWHEINGVEPSSLSLPSDNINDIIDISGYLSVLDGSNANTYVAPANGWISITMSSCSGIQAYITGLWGHQIVRPTAGGVRFFMPVLKNKTVNILIFGGTIDNARFIPCQGNI